MLSRDGLKWFESTENGVSEISPEKAHIILLAQIIDIVEQTDARVDLLDVEFSKKVEDIYELTNGWYDNESFIIDNYSERLTVFFKAILVDNKGPKTCEAAVRYAVREAWFLICNRNDMKILWELFKFYRDSIFSLTLKADEKEYDKYEGIVRAFYDATEFGKLLVKKDKISKDVNFELFEISQILAHRALIIYKGGDSISEEQLKELELAIKVYEIISIMVCSDKEDVINIYQDDRAKKVYDKCLLHSWYSACYAMDALAGLEENCNKIVKMIGGHKATALEKKTNINNSEKKKVVSTKSKDSFSKARKKYQRRLEEDRQTELLLAKEYVTLRQKGLDDYIRNTWAGISYWEIVGKRRDRLGNIQLTLKYPGKAKVYRYVHMSWDEASQSYSHYDLNQNANPYVGKFYKYFTDVNDDDFAIPDISVIKDLYLTNEEFNNYEVNTDRFNELLDYINALNLRKKQMKYVFDGHKQKGWAIVDKEYDGYILKLESFLYWFNDLFRNYKNDKSSVSQGEAGESFILSELAKYNEGDWIIFNSAILPITSPKTEMEKRIGEFENDLIIVNENGVFTLEVKNYQKGKIEIYSDGRVAHYDSRGELLPSEKQNVIEQSENHIRYLSMFLKDVFDDSSDDIKNVVHGIIVIANNDFEISKNELDYPIVRPVLLGRALNSSYGDKLSAEMQEKIANAIKKNLKASHKYVHKDYKAIFSMITDKKLKSICNACEALKISLDDVAVPENYRG